jgi:hypothetical protein
MGQFFEKSTIKRSQTRLFGSRVRYRPAIIWLVESALGYSKLMVICCFARFEENTIKRRTLTHKKLEILICYLNTQSAKLGFFYGAC